MNTLDWAIGLRYGVKGKKVETLRLIATRFRVSLSFICMIKQLNGMNDTVDSAVNSAFQNMREMQKKAERRIKREENKIRRAKGRLADREQELDDCIREEKIVTAGDVLDVAMRDGGGFAAHFTMDSSDGLIALQEVHARGFTWRQAVSGRK